MIDLLAYSASAFVLCSATTNNAKWFRLASLGSNICFIAYALFLDLTPLLLLHGILAPMNVFQSWRAWRKVGTAKPARYHLSSTTS